MQSVICDHACIYHTPLARLAFLEPLPRTIVDLRRVVVVPRLLLNARAHQLMREQLAAVVHATELRGGELCSISS